jgi:two-component system NtrC family sensor kinase
MECWIHFKCFKESCPVYQNKDLICWLTPDTLCFGKVQGRFRDKIKDCLSCEVFYKDIDREKWRRTIEEVADNFNLFKKELLKTKDRLSKSERLAVIGRLASGVAHEINNPLESILIYVDLLLEKVSSEEKKDLKVIKESAIRCKEIVKQLLNFAKESKLSFKPVRINELINHLLCLHPTKKEIISKNIKVIKEFTPHLPEILADYLKLQQAFTNIIQNALASMEKGGTLKINTLLKNNLVYINIKDTGKGILEEDMDKIFEPFFSKKEKGIGLGLAITYEIIEQHKGKIKVTSKPNKGTTFTVKLPLRR